MPTALPRLLRARDGSLALAFDPNQPRDPGGEGGGQWVKEGGNDNESSIEDDNIESFLDDETLEAMFGRPITKKDIALMAGAQPGDEVEIFLNYDEDDEEERGGISAVLVHVQNENYQATREIFTDNTIHNQEFNVEQEARGQGLGTKVFASQVKEAAKRGFKSINCFAARGNEDSGFQNGYYTWPRLGYDSPLNLIDGVSLPDNLASAVNISDLMKTKEGREWWKENGVQASMTFDLAEGSLSRKVLDTYVKEKASRGSARALSNRRRNSGLSLGQHSEEYERAAKADADLRSVEIAALPDVAAVLKAMHGSLLDKQFSASDLLLKHLAPRLARAMAAAELMGRRAEAKEYALQLDQYSVVSKKLRNAGLIHELNKLQKGYARKAYTILGELGSKIDGTVRAAVAQLKAANVKPHKAVTTLTDVLDNLGFSITKSQLETLYKTEMAIAFSAGQWKEWQDRWTDIAGFRYVTMGDDRVRPAHRAMDGVTLERDHPMWQDWIPPNGWNCRCRLVPIYKTPGVKFKSVKPKGKPQPDKGFDKNFAKDYDLKLAFDPNQPRDPGGEGGGQWVKEGGNNAEPKKQFKQASFTKRENKVGLKNLQEYGNDAKVISTSLLRGKNTTGMPFDTQTYKPLDWTRWPSAIMQVNPRDLAATQDAVDVSGVKEYLKSEDSPLDLTALPDIVLHEGQMLIGDGHHRVMAAALAGRKAISVRVYKKPLGLSALSLDYNPNQARVQAGHAGGGRWTKEDNWPSSTSDLTEVSSLGGSTGAKLMKDKNGKKFVLKKGASKEHAENEFLANEAYRLLNVPVPKSKLLDGALLTEFIEGTPLSELTGKEREQAEEFLRAQFGADAILGNWDVIGLSEDNIIVSKSGIPYRIDNGGALSFRAKGASKGAKWNDAVSELKSMRENGTAGKVFGKLTDEDVKKQVNGFLPKLGAAASAAKDPTLKARIETLHKMSDGTKPWPWGKKETLVDSNPIQKTYWQMSHTEKVKELGELTAGAGLTNHSLHQAALMNADEHDKKVYVNWYWDDEQKKAVAAAFPNKEAKVVEASKYIKKKYGYTTKELAKKIEDPNFGKALTTTPVTATTPSLKPKPYTAVKKAATPAFPMYKPESNPKAPAAFGTLKDNTEFDALVEGNWNKIKDKASHEAVKLTNYEKGMISSWTGAAHTIRAAEAKPEQATKDMLKDLAHFNSGLDKCPKFEGITYRGVKHVNMGTEFFEALSTPGATVEFLAPACSSRSVAVGHKFSGYGSHTLFRLKGNTGAAIELVGGYSEQEREVIIRKGSTFKVVGYAHNVQVHPSKSHVTHVFDLEQVHDEESKAKAKKLALSLANKVESREDRMTESDPDTFLDVRFPLEAIIGKE